MTVKSRWRILGGVPVQQAFEERLYFVQPCRRADRAAAFERTCP